MAATAAAAAAAATPQQQQQHVVVCGGGIIGASCAYHLAKRGLKTTVVEAVAPACSASGKAGGFLALDWCDDSPLGALARRSFALHTELATELGVDCGYRRMRTHSVSVRQQQQQQQKSAGDADAAAPLGDAAHRRRLASLPAWVRRSDSVGQTAVIGTEQNTAQVTPELLTKALLQRAQDAGGHLQLATVTGLVVEGPHPPAAVPSTAAAPEGRRIMGVRVRDSASGKERVLAADAVIFAMGAWSSQLRSWLPPDLQAAGGGGGGLSVEVTGLKVHSILLQDNAGTTADALFLAYRGADGKSLEPEVYPRASGQVYICGVADEGVPVPATAADVHPRPEAIAQLRGVAASVSQELGGAELLRGQACYLPCTPDNLPVIGRVPGLQNAYVATGHSCWGILNAPATGEALAELLVDGQARSVDLRPFDPARFA